MIKQRVKEILEELPLGVELEAAVKKRTVVEIQEAVDAGVRIIGENYVQEAQAKFMCLDRKVRRHLIGNLQKNKVKLAVKIFDVIETLDSVALACVLDRECAKIGKVMPVLVEVNSAAEARKSGVLPQNVEEVVDEFRRFKNLKPVGLMTMGPWVKNPRDIRPFFRETKKIFDRIKAGTACAGGEWKYLSMGMSDTYKVAYEEGANIVRVGTAIFGRR